MQPHESMLTRNIQLFCHLTSQYIMKKKKKTHHTHVHQPPQKEMRIHTNTYQVYIYIMLAGSDQFICRQKCIWSERLLLSEAIIVIFSGSPEMICFKGHFSKISSDAVEQKIFKRARVTLITLQLNVSRRPTATIWIPSRCSHRRAHALAREQRWWALAAFLILCKLKQTGIWWDVFLKQGCPNF